MLLSISIQVDIHNKHLDYCLLPSEYVMCNMLCCNGNQELRLYCSPVLWNSIKTKYYVNESCWSKQSRVRSIFLYIIISTDYREIVTSLEPIRGVASYDSCGRVAEWQCGTNTIHHGAPHIWPCEGWGEPPAHQHLVMCEEIPATSIWLERLQTALCHWVWLTSIIYYIQKDII